MSASQFCRIATRLLAAVLLIVMVPTASSAQGATGRFEVYCDGVGFFLANVEGAPAPRKLFLFLHANFPAIPYVPKEEWTNVFVYRNGCVADGKCQVLTHGKVRLDSEFTPDSRRVSVNTTLNSTANISVASLRQDGACADIKALYEFANEHRVHVPPDFRLPRGGK